MHVERNICYNVDHDHGIPRKGSIT
jgi:hypothetical protein